MVQKTLFGAPGWGRAPIGNAEYAWADGRSSGNARSNPVIRMIFSSDGRAEASMSWRPFCRAYRAARASAPRPEASQKVRPDRSTGAAGKLELSGLGPIGGGGLAPGVGNFGGYHGCITSPVWRWRDVAVAVQ